MVEKNVRRLEEKMPTEAIQFVRLSCCRCGHEWLPRSEKLPEVCPNCGSAYWNIPRKRQLKEEEGK